MRQPSKIPLLWVQRAGEAGTADKSGKKLASHLVMSRLGAQMFRSLLLVVAIFTGSVSVASAEIEKIATICGQEICFNWWPMLSEVEGWRHDRAASLSYGINAQVPDGKTFTDAEAVIYANALYKPRKPNTKSLSDLIADDKQQILASTPDIEIAEADALSTQDGQVLESFTHKPRSTGRWERIAYGEEDDFYLIFAVSAKTIQGLEGAMNAYLRFVNQYEKTLNRSLQTTPAGENSINKKVD